MKEKEYKPVHYIIFGILLIVAYQYVLPILYSLLVSTIFPKDNIWIANIVNILYYAFVFTGLIVIFHKSLKKEWKIFREKKKELIKVGLSAWGKGLFLMALSNMIVLTITSDISGNEAFNREILSAMPLYAITVMCFFGPIIEELVFRKAFRPAFQNKYLYATVTSLIFALLHVINGFDPLTISNVLANWKQIFFLLPYSSLAFFFALSYYDTKTIFTSSFSHILHNTLTVILLLLSTSLL